MSMAYIPPRQPEVKHAGTFQGISIWTDESLPHGTIELRDDKGKTLARIVNISHARIGSDPQS